MAFCLPVCQMCGKGTFLQIQSHIQNAQNLNDEKTFGILINVTH